MDRTLVYTRIINVRFDGTRFEYFLTYVYNYFVTYWQAILLRYTMPLDQ